MFAINDALSSIFRKQMYGNFMRMMHFHRSKYRLCSFLYHLNKHKHNVAILVQGLNDSMMRLRIPFRIIFLVTSLSAAKVLDPKVDESTGSSALLQVPDHHATRTVRRNKISNSHPFRADEPGSAQQVHRPQKNGQSLNSTSTLAHQDESSACKGPSSILDLRIPDEGASGQALSGVKPHEEKLDSSRRVDPERAHAFSREGSLISGLIFTTTVGVAFFTRGQKTPRSGATLLRVLNIAGVLIALGVAAGSRGAWWNSTGS